MEQISNARALKQLGYGEVMDSHDTPLLMRWLTQPNPEPRPYPNVARAVVEWLHSGMLQEQDALARELWAQYA